MFIFYRSGTGASEVIFSFLLLFFLIKKEAKKSRTKDVHPLRPAAMTIDCTTVASTFKIC
jgi:hypothetical protein